MERFDALELHPASLPPGACVGEWEVRAWHNRGSYGTVYRAVRRGHEDTPPVALKLALHPRDERFAREAELLSRLHHPHVPRQLDHGHWRSPVGHLYPFLVMEWVEGVDLYRWAAQCPITSRQALAVLAHLSRALEALHVAGGVHRDVKGDNILVRPADGYAFLTDFGAGTYVGADTLTGPPFAPGTPRYRSPEAWAFAQSQPTTSFATQPADDVFALGVSAYRLVTGEYPPPTAPHEEASRVWYQEGSGLKPPGELNVHVTPLLDALILRMLSVRPEERGTARELAEALEQAALQAGPEAALPLFTEARRARPQWPSEELVAAPLRPYFRARPLPMADGTRVRLPRGRPWLTALAVGGLLTVGVGWALHVRTQHMPALERQLGEARKIGGDTTAVGDTVLAAPTLSSPLPSVREGIGLDTPPKPLPGQYRPDANGRCPGKKRIALNGGCWLKWDVDPEECEGTGYVYRGVCYVPTYLPTRSPTSSPVKSSGTQP